MTEGINGIVAEDSWETRMQKTQAAVKAALLEQYRASGNPEMFFAKTVDILLEDASGMTMVQILVGVGA